MASTSDEKAIDSSGNLFYSSIYFKIYVYTAK